jgi:dTDP-4-amino-4,6-dideoxygalactose transaminase
MPCIAERAMRRTDLAEVLRTRQAHYAHYVHLFRDTPGVRLPFPDPGASACPWLFPMIIDNREAFSVYCRQHAGLVPQTFGAVLHDSLHHDKDAHMTGDAAYLADHVVCLPIHQDLTTNEIEATGRKLLEYFKLEAEQSAWSR